MKANNTFRDGIVAWDSIVAWEPACMYTVDLAWVEN